MRHSRKSIYVIFGILVLIFSWLRYDQHVSLSGNISTPAEERRGEGQSNAVPPLVVQNQPGSAPFSKDSKLPARTYNWMKELKAPVDFLTPPVTDNEGLFCVINPEYKFLGKSTMEVVEDGYWYHHALNGGRGAILFGKGNGRPPWNYKVAEMFIENNELKLRHRVSFGGSKGVRTRLLLDLDESTLVSKIGIAMDEMVPGSPWNYPPIVFDEIVISSDEVEKLPLIPIKPNWAELDTEFKPTEIFLGPVRVIWLQFQLGGRKIVRIDN